MRIESEEIMYLENINHPEDVKKLSMNQLVTLSGEMREVLLSRSL